MSGWFGWANAVAFTVGSQAVRWSDLLGNIFALATVGFALRRHMLTWPVQIASCILLFGANVSVHLGGNAARQVALGVMAGYGWWRWRRGIARTSDVPVRFATMRERIVLVGALAIGTLAFAWLLSATNASFAPLPDAYIFIGSLAATFAQARGWVEFWVVWVLVDVVGVPLAVSHGLVVSGAVYGVFLAMCLLGIRDWTIRSRQIGVSA
jgi:nicotinamide mononucleotide transporter